jgi:decaprenyl-phosphate phosphoribosyltransferase
MKSYLRLMRLKHYLKNGLIILPLIFSGNLFDYVELGRVLVGFIVFSLLASVIYIINDIHDVENDRKHPTKCKRPLASGEISIRNAIILLVILTLLASVSNYFIAEDQLLIWGTLLFYVGINVAYSAGIKNVALLDVFVLVLGYLVRVYYGALIIGVEVSSWLYLTVISMAFFLGLGKRRNEMGKQGTGARKVLKQYSVAFLDKNMYTCLGLTIMFYSLWCETMVRVLGNSLILSTVPLVIMICMRYSLIIEGNSAGDPVDVVFSDRIILLLIALYGIIIFTLLYGVR